MDCTSLILLRINWSKDFFMQIVGGKPAVQIMCGEKTSLIYSLLKIRFAFIRDKQHGKKEFLKSNGVIFLSIIISIPLKIVFIKKLFTRLNKMIEKHFI